MSMRSTEHDDPTGTGHKYRWECPAGHKSWERVNNHVFCHACSKERHQDAGVDPEWDELRDSRTGELVPYLEAKADWPSLEEVSAY